MQDQIVAMRSTPRLEGAREVAEASIMPDFARRFPDQFEDAVIAVAHARERMRSCTNGACR